MGFPSVAAVVPTRNRCHKTLRFLAAISQQTYPNLKVIIVDSNSTDKTPEIVVDKYPAITVLKASDRDYWAGATNIGVHFALQKSYDFILTINDDSIIEPNYVEGLVKISCQYDTLILGSRIHYLSQPNIIWSLGVYSNWGKSKFLSLYCHDIDIQDLSNEITSQELIEVDALPGNGVLIRRDVYEKIGLYDAIFTPHYHADTEFTLRAGSKRISIFVTPKVALLNDFEKSQKDISLGSLGGLYDAFANKKSHLFILPWIYLFIRYCPFSSKLSTLLGIMPRFRKLVARK